MSVPPRSERKYDVVCWGATGFTGKLVANYLAGGTGRPSNEGRGPLRWAIGGRDHNKLAAVKDQLEIDHKIANQPDVIIASADDAEELAKMTAQTRVVITTVGPFLQHGEPLIKACIKTGTDYVDSTGESVWVWQMIQKYEEAAEKAGCVLVNMSGFDSIPADLGAFLAGDELVQKYHTKVTHMQGYTTTNNANYSGGTMASLLGTLDMPSKDVKRQADPYLLNPSGTQPKSNRPKEKDQTLPCFDETIQKWTTPWLMATINTRVVRRSLGLRKKYDPKGVGMGDNAAYNETAPTPNAFVAFLMWLAIAIFIGLCLIKPTRKLLLKFALPSPGEGPSEEQRMASRFNHRVIATGEDGTKVESLIAGGDPGYEDTAKMLGETGLMLAQDREKLDFNKLINNQSKGSNGCYGGFVTPSFVGGHQLAERLKATGMTIKVGKFKPQQRLK